MHTNRCSRGRMLDWGAQATALSATAPSRRELLRTTNKKSVAVIADREISHSFRKFANFAGATEATRRLAPRAIYPPARSFSVGQTAPRRQAARSFHGFIAVAIVSKSRCYRPPSHVGHRGKVHPRNPPAPRQLSSPGARFGRRLECSRQSHTTPRSRLWSS